MNLITSTLNDFYYCCKIPVKAISFELNEIYKIGYDKTFNKLFPTDEIINYYKNGHDVLNKNIKLN